jgi:hypothetical protein
LAHSGGAGGLSLLFFFSFLRSGDANDSGGELAPESTIYIHICINASLFEFSLCLSRACLGKRSFLDINCSKDDRART